ncbi:hypothetical protein LEMLEM_LOCUS21050 [Lemmus lemmus]
MVLAPASSATWSQNCVKSERQAPCPAGPPPSSSKLLRKSQLLEARRSQFLLQDPPHLQRELLQIVL